MVGTAQQVEQSLFAVFMAFLESRITSREIPLKLRRTKALAQKFRPRQFVHNPRMQHHVAGRPARHSKQVQDTPVDVWPLHQQCQVALAPQQGFNPIYKTKGSCLRCVLVVQPCGRLVNQAMQTQLGSVTQGLSARICPQSGDAFAVRARQVHPQRFIADWPIRCVARTRFAVSRLHTEQGVKLLRHQLTVGIQFRQQIPGGAKAHGGGDPGQIIVIGWQNMGLAVVKILNTVLDIA